MSRKSLLGGAVLLLLLWEGAALVASSSLLPSPMEVFRAFFLSLPKELGWHTLVSCWRIGVSMALATALGAPLGLVLGQNRQLNALSAPLIYITYPVPKIALLPIILLFLGIGDLSKIFLITLILFFQVLVMVRDASHNLRPELIHSVLSLGARRWQLMRHVYLPACLPACITALRVNTSIAIAVLFIAESFATRAGLGYYIMDSWQALAYPKMYAAVVALSLLGFSIYTWLDYLEGRLCRWVRAGAI